VTTLEKGGLSNNCFMPNQESPVIRIEPAARVAFVNWAELWRYRDLLELLIKRDLTVRYRQTILGPLWLILQPLVLTIVFSGVFGAVGQFSTDGIPRPLFYLAGLVPWAYFSLVFGQVASSLHSNVHLFSKVYFPRLVIPLSVLVSGLLALGIQVVCLHLVRGFYLLSGWDTGSFSYLDALLWLPFALLLLMGFTFGAGLWMAVLTARYRDLVQVSPFFVQVLMYVTPLLYPLSALPERYRPIASLNPLTVVLEAHRLAVFGVGSLSVSSALIAAVATLVMLGSGLRAFSKMERTVVDSI
jgi:lipopolysaccharide transport system permease protein